MKKFAKYCLYLLVIWPLLSFAAVPIWQIIPEESSLTFTATQNNAPVSGNFKKFNGTIHFDPAQLKMSSVEITVDMNSLSTSYQDLTSTLDTSDWLNVKIFPEAHFKATDFTQLSQNTYEANGTLTIRDKSMPVKLQFSAQDLGNDKVQVKGSTLLKRSNFGVGQGEWASTEEIKDPVKVEFVITAKRQN
jgi:polyisoprenoid-binding protein YceI